MQSLAVFETRKSTSDVEARIDRLRVALSTLLEVVIGLNDACTALFARNQRQYTTYLEALQPCLDWCEQTELVILHKMWLSSSLLHRDVLQSIDTCKTKMRRVRVRQLQSAVLPQPTQFSTIKYEVQLTSLAAYLRTQLVESDTLKNRILRAKAQLAALLTSHPNLAKVDGVQEGNLESQLLAQLRAHQLAKEAAVRAMLSTAELVCL